MSKSRSGLLVLDSFFIKDLSRWKSRKEEILRYYWDWYSALAYERTKAAEQILMALLTANIPYKFRSVFCKIEKRQNATKERKNAKYWEDFRKK